MNAASCAAQAADVSARETQLSSELDGVRAELQRATLVKQTLSARVRFCSERL